MPPRQKVKRSKVKGSKRQLGVSVPGFIVAVIFFCCASSAFAGGAAAMKKQNQQRLMQQQQMQQRAAVQQNVKVADVAGLDEVIVSLNRSARDWRLIIDAEAKAAVVAYYIGQFSRQGATIRLPPMYYVQMIDGMAQSEPQMLQNPFPQVLQVAAILEYDFDNGQNKDALALQVLGSREAVMKNRERLMQMRQGQ